MWSTSLSDFNYTKVSAIVSLNNLVIDSVSTPTILRAIEVIFIYNNYYILYILNSKTPQLN